MPWCLVGKPWLWKPRQGLPLTVPRKHRKQLLVNKEDHKRLSSRGGTIISNRVQEEDIMTAVNLSCRPQANSKDIQVCYTSVPNAKIPGRESENIYRLKQIGSGFWCGLRECCKACPY